MITMVLQEDSTDIKFRKAIGKEHLYQNRLEDALAVFAGILRDNPDDVESLVILGDLYLASGDSSTACQLYSRAIQNKKDEQIEQRLHLAEIERNASPHEAPEKIPTHPEAVARLLQRLTGRINPVTQTEINMAAEMLERILRSPNPSQEVAKNLNQIDSLLPALIELNIRQAKLDGRFDLADALVHLQSSIQFQLSAPSPKPQLSQPTNVEQNPEKVLDFNRPLLVLVNEEKNISSRIELLIQSLNQLGQPTTLSKAFVHTNGQLPQIIIASNPHANPQMMASLATAASLNIPIIIDNELDFEQMPLDHPLYSQYGLGTPINNRAYLSALLLANLITVPSLPMLTSLLESGYPARMIPDGWSKENKLWQNSPKDSNLIRLGWIGQAGQYEDVAQIRRIIVRILREHPETQLVIVGDQRIYHLFESIPVNRRRYLPLPTEQERPLLFDQIDLLFVPYRNTPYNRSQSDKIIMEASVKGIPWVASPMPSFTRWQAGGLIAQSPLDWHNHLDALVSNPILRENLSRAGKNHAQTREMNHLRNAWLEAIRTARSNRYLQTSPNHSDTTL